MPSPSAKLQFAFRAAPLRFLRRVMLAWLQGVYRSFPAKQDCYHFAGNDDPNNEIRIQAKTPWSPDDGEVRPAIILIRQPTSWNNPGFGGGGMVQDTRFSQDKRRKTALISGTYTFNCLSKVGDEAEHLAWTTSLWIMECMELISRLGFHSIGMPVVGNVAPAPDAMVQTKTPEWLVCSVNLPVTFQFSWSSELRDQSQIECITLAMETEIEELVQSVIIDRE